MLRLWKWYQNCLAVHPLTTQVISSGLIWGFGDIAAQSITNYTANKQCQLVFMVPCTHEKEWIGLLFQLKMPSLAGTCIFIDNLSATGVVFQDEEKGLKINWKRVATTSLFGFGFVGPVGHFWYERLDQFIRFRLLMQPKSLRFVAAKVAIDSILFGPLDLLVFFTYMGFSTGKSVPQIKQDLKRDYLPALVLEGGIWPLVQVLNFRFVPVRYQLQYVNFFCLLDSCFLSWIEQQRDATWKQWFKFSQPFNEKKGQGG